MTMTVDLSRVLVMPGWRAGFCPIHYGSGNHGCSWWCRDARFDVAKLQADYQAFWPTYQQRAA